MTSLLGHDTQIRTLLGAAASGRMHHGWILAGPRGVGKGRFARMAALRLLADAAGPPVVGEGLEVPSGHPIAHLFAADTHPDYMELTRLEKDNGELARNINVDQVRGLQRLFATSPSMSARRIVVIDSADELERAAANALLKSLEEPPADTLFLLVSHTPSRLLPTIRSRCRMLRFSALGDEDMRQVLRNHLPDAPPDEMEAMLAAAAGSPGRAINSAGLGLGELEKELRDIAATGDPDNSRRLTLARRLSIKSARSRYEAMLERVPTFLAAAARERQGEALRDAIAAWERARELAGGAIILSLDPATVAFELATLVAGLSRPVENA